MDDLNKALEKQAKKALMTKKSALAFLRRAGIVAKTGTELAPRYRGGEEPTDGTIIQECFRKDVYESWYSACEMFAYAIDHTPSVACGSSLSAVEQHPAYKALVSLGILALEYIRVDGSDTWWKLLAADNILKNLGIKYEMPRYMAGRLEEQSQHLRLFLLKKVFSKGGPLHKYTVAPDNCACGKKGKWIADGISRFGYYCKKCSGKALEEA